MSASASPALRSRSAERRAPLLSEAALLRGELGDRVGALTGKGAADLLRVRRRLLLDGAADADPGFCDEPIGRAGAPPRAPEREPQADRERERDSEAGGQDPDEHAGTL